MSFELVPQEAANRLSTFGRTATAEPGIFDNFFSSAGNAVMRGFAEAGRAASMVGAVGAALQDTDAYGQRTTTRARDRYFKRHDEIFGRAVEYWTPNPREVGIAGEVVGQLLGAIPLLIASPAALIAKTQLSVGEDLVRKGVDSTRAGAVGAAQGAGLALGVWMPILGRNLATRALVGGAAANVAQGMATRGVSGQILEGTVAAKDFEAFDPAAITLDALLGLAFGGLAHLSPAQRAQGEAAWKRIEGWTKGLKPSDVDALATLKQAEHINFDSLPGSPKDLTDINAHVQRMRAGLDQMLRDEPVNVDGMPRPEFEADPQRVAEDRSRFRLLGGLADETALRESLSDADFARLTDGLRQRERVGHTMEILNLYDRTVSREIAGNERHAIRYGLVDEQVGLAIKSATDQDLEGYRHSVDNQAILKILKDHGRDATEAPRGQIPVTREDIALIPEIVARPDLIESAETSSYGAPLIRYVKRFNGTTYFVEEVRRGREELAAKTMWKTPSRDPMLPGGPRDPTSETLGGNLPRGESLPESGAAPAAGTDDPIRMAAEQLAIERPDLFIPMGTDAQGKTIAMDARAYLENARAEAELASRDVKLFEIAAGCMLGGG